MLRKKQVMLKTFVTSSCASIDIKFPVEIHLQDFVYSKSSHLLQVSNFALLQAPEPQNVTSAPGVVITKAPLLPTSPSPRTTNYTCCHSPL